MTKKRHKSCSPAKTESWKRKKLQVRDLRQQRIRDAENAELERLLRLVR